jgi:hypothetical protein
MGKFPAPWGGISPRSLESTVSVGHCKTKSSREACEAQCSDTAPLWGADVHFRVKNCFLPHAKSVLEAFFTASSRLEGMTIGHLSRL